MRAAVEGDRSWADRPERRAAEDKPAARDVKLDGEVNMMSTSSLAIADWQAGSYCGVWCSWCARRGSRSRKDQWSGASGICRQNQDDLAMLDDNSLKQKNK